MKKILLLLSIVFLTMSSCKDKCADTNCLNDGICVDGDCNCPAGYSGETCEIKDLCYNNDCNGNGNCNDGTCACAANYEGVNCENTVAKKFLGTYDIVANGTLDIDGTNQDFVNEPGTAKLYQGEDPDEIVMYVQLKLVTDAIPMTVEAFGDVDGLEYTADVQAQTINADIGGIFTVNLNYTIAAEGVLNAAHTELNSTVTFNGDLSGVITCTGTKQ